MKQFFKFTFASCLGVMLALVGFTFISFMVIGGMAASFDKKPSLNSNTVLKLTLTNALPEKTNNIERNPYKFDHKSVVGLQDFLRCVEHAKEDDDIRGIYLDLSWINTGFAGATSIRNAIEDFKESGKFVLAYSKYFSEGAYFMGSVADEVYLHPLGNVEFDGLSAQIPFFKELLDKLGVKMHVYYAGQFKSATEPFRLNEMSESNRLQMKEFIDGLYENFLFKIAESRSMSPKDLDRLSNNLSIRNAEDALHKKLVDGLLHEDEVIDQLRDKLDLDEDDKLRTISLSDYYQASNIKKNRTAKDKIAVIYAEGNIVYGEGSPGQTAGDDYARMIRKIRKKDDIKAIVLRVNSPGGNSMASEQIHREIQLCKDAGLPVVVSMGAYAASGGYYIACHADSIYAEKNTLTGSIGVYKMFPEMTELFEDKFGIRFDSVNTSKYAVGVNPYFSVSDSVNAWLQEDTDDFYITFLEKVAKGRGMSVDAVNEIAQGRIWLGDKALELGLVDKIGDMDDAIAAAAGMAELDNYRLTEYPRTKEPIEQLIDEFTKGNSSKSYILRSELKELFPVYEHVKAMKEAKGVQARLPFVIHFK